MTVHIITIIKATLNMKIIYAISKLRIKWICLMSDYTIKTQTELKEHTTLKLYLF